MSQAPAQDESHSLDRYLAILQFAELELDLARAGEVEQLASLAARWEALTEGLPAQPPAAALGLLQRAQLLHERTQTELNRLRSALLGELEQSARASRTVRGYSRVRRHGAVLDHSA